MIPSSSMVRLRPKGVSMASAAGVSKTFSSRRKSYSLYPFLFSYARAPALAMACFASPPPLPPLLPPSHHRPTRTPLITCGPRDGRPQLARGRMLSSEAILAVQALKRAARRHSPSNLSPVLSDTLARLLKPDLLAALRELLRQGRTDLALLVLAAARREPWYRPDYGLYAEVVAAMARDGMEVGGLVREVAAEGLAGGDERGLGRLVRAAIAAGSGGAVVALWGMMKDGGWACEERLGRALSRGLRQLGEVGVAEEVDRECHLFGG